MALFFRIVNNRLIPAGDTPRLGFNQNDPYYIPDEYLENKEEYLKLFDSVSNW